MATSIAAKKIFVLVISHLSVCKNFFEEESRTVSLDCCLATSQPATAPRAAVKSAIPEAVVPQAVVPEAVAPQAVVS